MNADMEGFHELLLKVKEAHEREVEGWQMKVQELSNKKGCDTKRMEELFTRNQQMKEQQRILTENIKNLENRLRAGLCDRCTVTQEVAKRRQQEFEVSQIQSLQHITLLVGEVKQLKKDNRRLRDENASLRAVIKGASEQFTNAEVKPVRSPDLSPPAGPTATVINRIAEQPTEGDVVVKTEPYHRNDDDHLRQMQRIPFNIPLSMVPSLWKAETSPSFSRERRHSVEVNDQRATTSSQAPPKNLSGSGEVTTAKQIPCRPQPIKSVPAAHPWDPTDWVSVAETVARANFLQQPSQKLGPVRFTNPIQLPKYGGYSGSRRPGFGPLWHKPTSPHSPAKEPTVFFRLRNLADHGHAKDKKEVQPSNTVPAEASKEHYDAPLDLSDRGKSKSSPDREAGEARNGEMDSENNPHTLLSSPSPSESQPAAVMQEEFSSEQVDRDEERREESNAEQDVLTISMRPVVLLESLNPVPQTKESSTTNGKSSAVTVLECSSGDDEEEEDEGEMEESASGPESNQGCKRKRTSDMNGHEERKVKITMRTEDKS